MGTPDLARTVLAAVLNASFLSVAAVVTQPDRPKGRDLRLTPSPVKELALERGIPVLQPERARNPEFVEQLRAIRPQLIVVAAYGQILPKTILDIPKHGCLNVHTSLLPRYRGAAPIQWAILNDDPKTGVTIMKMDEGMDTGEIVSVEETAIAPSDDAQSLHDRLAVMGATLLVRTLPNYLSGAISPQPQSADGIVIARKIKKNDGLIDWNNGARAIWNRVRGLVPWPAAYSHLPATPKPLAVKVWKAEPLERPGAAGEIVEASASGIVVGCGTGSLRILELQRENARRLAAPQFLAGHPLRPGDKFV